MDFFDSLVIFVFMANFLLVIYAIVLILQLRESYDAIRSRVSHQSTDITHISHTVDILEKRTGATANHLHEMQALLNSGPKPTPPMTISPLPKLKKKS